jgi:hypothetical protein
LEISTQGVHDNLKIVSGRISLTQSLASYINEKIDFVVKLRSERIEIHREMKEGK